MTGSQSPGSQTPDKEDWSGSGDQWSIAATHLNVLVKAQFCKEFHKPLVTYHERFILLQRLKGVGGVAQRRRKVLLGHGHLCKGEAG